jgi:hypothetical protein
MERRSPGAPLFPTFSHKHAHFNRKLILMQGIFIKTLLLYYSPIILVRLHNPRLILQFDAQH